MKQIFEEYQGNYSILCKKQWTLVTIKIKYPKQKSGGSVSEEMQSVILSVIAEKLKTTKTG